MHKWSGWALALALVLVQVIALGPAGCGDDSGAPCDSVDCTNDWRGDQCVDGVCVCSATGARCAAGEVCTATGCESCEPDCAGRCAGADDGCGGTCPTADCDSGCCDPSGVCLGPSIQTPTACGDAGQQCLDCTADNTTDSCLAGACVCAATGAPCPAGEYCSASGCGSCQPDCTAKCAGADDGCGGYCPSTDCAAGCCDATGTCVGHAAQSNAACGTTGQDCVDCGLWGETCDAGAHACLSGLQRDARFISQNVPLTATPGQVLNVSITMQNIGTDTWTAATSYKLGAQNPQDNSNWGFNRVDLDPTDAIAPGQSKTFSFQVTAPSAPGIHNFQWRMLEESVVWFGAHSRYVPVWVDGGSSVVVCEAARNLAGTATNATPAIQGCIDAASAGDIVELPAGVYSVDSAITVAAAAITLRTEGTDHTQARCGHPTHSCAELMASTSFGDTGGILQVSAPGTVVDHLVVNGNKTARASTPSGTQCASFNNAYGYNMRILGNQIALTNSVTKNTLCGTGCEGTGVTSGVVLWRNLVADAGVHNVGGLWADGVTAHDPAGATFTENEFVDNTDVDFIFGGCQVCYIQDNLLWHTAAFEGSSFAALMLHAWPSTSGNFIGSDTSRNHVDCGPSHRCGIGLYVGSDAWYITDVYGGAVHHNRVTNAEQGLLIDDAHDLAVYTNPVSNSASATDASCGTVSTNDYAWGTTTQNVDQSSDTLGSSFANVDFDGCIPNWWQ